MTCEVIGSRRLLRHCPAMTSTSSLARPAPVSQRGVGPHIRAWRQRRRLSQLDFALAAGISQRHLSWIESGRSVPSRGMILRLADHLDVPLRERNAMVLAAGYAPVYSELRFDDPAFDPARRAVEAILKGHEPWPALAVDRRWHLVAANAAVAPLLTLVSDASLLAPPVNVLRLALDPGGLAPHILNLGEWRGHILERLRTQAAATGDPDLAALRETLAALPGPGHEDGHPESFGGIAVPLVLQVPGGVLSLISTVTVFGTPRDVTLAELALETFFPLDEASASLLRAMATGQTSVEHGPRR